MKYAANKGFSATAVAVGLVFLGVSKAWADDLVSVPPAFQEGSRERNIRSAPGQRGLTEVLPTAGGEEFLGHVQRIVEGQAEMVEQQTRRVQAQGSAINAQRERVDQHDAQLIDLAGRVDNADAQVNQSNGQVQALQQAVGDLAVRPLFRDVPQGQLPTDAVNVGQMRRYTDESVGALRSEIRDSMEDMDRMNRRGIASVAALQMTTPYVPGRVAVNAGTALYRGTAAVAMGASYWNVSGRFNVNAGIATAGGNSTIVRAGIGVIF